MLTRQPTSAMITEWKRLYAAYRPHMEPNRKSGTELIAWLCEQYPVTEDADPELADVICTNITENPHSAAKLPEGTAPAPRAFWVEPAGTGAALYAEQKEIWKECGRILVIVDTVTGEFHVEGSCRLWDAMLAFRGLDAQDLENCYLTAEYLYCTGKAERGYEN